MTKKTTISIRQQEPERKVVGFVELNGKYAFILGTVASGGGMYNLTTGSFTPGMWKKEEFDRNYEPLYSGDQIVVTTTTEEVKTL